MSAKAHIRTSPFNIFTMNALGRSTFSGEFSCDDLHNYLHTAKHLGVEPAAMVDEVVYFPGSNSFYAAELLPLE